MAKIPTLSPTGQITADRLRVREILESPAGLRNPRAARKLALVDCLSAATALDVLASLPAESAYLEALDREAPPVIGGPAMAAPGAPGGEDYRARRLAEIKVNVAAFNAGRGL